MRPARRPVATHRDGLTYCKDEGKLPALLGLESLAQGITDAWGVRPKAAARGPERQIQRKSEGGIDTGEAGGWEPSRRLSGGRCGRY